MAKIQIDADLWESIVRYHTAEDVDDDEAADLHRVIVAGIQAKRGKQMARAAYTAYKAGETEEEREAGRQYYLNARGVPQSFRW